MITKGKNKTHKLCRGCDKLKPVADFHRNKSGYDGLVSRCKECRQRNRLGSGGIRYNGLHKRPFPSGSRCEICNIEFSKGCYHPNDDNNPSLGIWICGICDYFIEGIDEIGKNPWKVDIYHKWKEGIESLPETLINPGPFSPLNGIHKLYSSNNTLTHKWCPHCGKMKPINEFSKRRSNADGLQNWCRGCKQICRIFCPSRKQYTGLSKRANPGYCELCNGRTHLVYHHWDDTNRSKGIWVCQTNKCHNLAEAIDKLDSGSLLPDEYIKLKQVIMRGNNEGILL